ncbi:MAG: hypothetical protein L0331_01230, partial [Chloroflexi bacterium]|nr:hypothetical protein [Chloroflexota bacterium]
MQISIRVTHLLLCPAGLSAKIRLTRSNCHSHLQPISPWRETMHQENTASSSSRSAPAAVGYWLARWRW